MRFRVSGSTFGMKLRLWCCFRSSFHSDCSVPVCVQRKPGGCGVAAISSGAVTKPVVWLSWGEGNGDHLYSGHLCMRDGGLLLLTVLFSVITLI